MPTTILLDNGSAWAHVMTVWTTMDGVKLQDFLRDVNGDIILVLHPLDVVPAAPIDGDPHLLKAGEDNKI